MIPLFVAAGAVLVAAGGAAYKYYTKDDKKSGGSPSPSPSPSSSARPADQVKYLSGIAIWGRPDVGKTTFISNLLNKPLADQKVQTASKVTYTTIPAFRVNGQLYSFNKIVDMPGNVDRFDAWLEQAQTNKHVFYIFNIEKLGDKAYMRGVASDVVKTMEAMEQEKVDGAKLHVIASHVDKSTFQQFDQANLVNEIMKSDDVRRVYEKLQGSIKGFFYGVNLTNDESFKNLMRNIVQDIHG